MLKRLFNNDRSLLQNLKGIFDNRVATLADVNTVIDSLNKSEIFASKKFKFIATYTNGALRTTGCVRSCSDGGSGCWSCLNSCSYQDSKAISTFVQTGTGVYELTLIPDGDYGTRAAVAVTVGNFTEPGQMASVKQISTNLYQIKTFNVLDGGAPSNIFKDTLISIEYFAKLTTL